MDPNDPLKQFRKDFHQKIFKNPPETVVALGEAAGKKAGNAWHRELLLGILAGFFIGLGGAVALATAGGISKLTVTSSTVNNVTTVTNSAPILTKLALGATFPVGLVLVVVLGAELFTGNVMVMALGLMAKKITWQQFLANWGLSYLGNFIGATLVGGLMLGCKTYSTEPYLSFLTNMTVAKVYEDWGTLFIRGVMCNILVCAAISMSTSSEDIMSKVVVIYAAIFSFVVCGFEHSIANMFYLSTGIFYGANAGFGDYLWRNLLSVTLGNIVGGVIVLAAPYFYIYYVVLAPKVLMPKSEIIASRQRRVSGSSMRNSPTLAKRPMPTASKQSDRDVEMGTKKSKDRENLIEKKEADNGHTHEKLDE